MPVEVPDRAGLPEMLHTQRNCPVAVNTAKPGKRRRMAIDHGHEAAMPWQLREQAFGCRDGIVLAPGAGTLRRCPPGIQPIGGSHGQNPDIASCLRDQSGGSEATGGRVAAPIARAVLQTALAAQGGCGSR